MVSNKTLRRAGAAAFALIGAAALLTGSALAQKPANLSIQVLSSRPDMISGGDARIEVRGPTGLKLSLNGGDITGQLHREGGVSTGVVTGLKIGPNTLRATAGKSAAALTVTNYSLNGPIISGPHMSPYECRTEESGMGKAIDADCNAPTRIDYFYKTTAAGTQFKPLAKPGDRPTDLATTTTIDGKTVPYVVKVESGTINRTIYRIATLQDGWNKRLVVSFGGGAGTKYNQGSNKADSVLNDLFLGRGFAHINATELVNGLHGNAVLQAESLMMIKEHFIEEYGAPKWTAGSGGSGGAIQQLLITQMYPGLLNGLQPSLSFPDSSMNTPDCGVLQNYWKTKGDPKVWTDEKKAAVDGFTKGTCGAWERSFVPVAMANYKPGCELKDQSLIFDARTNPKGARCAVQEMRGNFYGHDPKTGYAYKTGDNIGIQYGLKGLNDGRLTVDEFLDLNEKVGGNDIDGSFVAERSVGDINALRAAYGWGFINSGGGGLATVPIMHYRTYNDPLGDIHDRHRDLTIRARLVRANGDANNETLWVGPGLTPGAARGASVDGGVQPAAQPRANLAALVLDSMTQWLDGMAADPAPLSHAKVVRHKPRTAVDAYFDTDGVKHAEVASLDGPGGYNKMYPNHSETRLMAGAPLTNDVAKCQLKPVTPADYKVKFTPAQQAKLKAIYPTGVCDYTKPGVGQVKFAGTWRRWAP